MRHFLAALAAIALLVSGCRNQNPYAMFGPSTVPPPNMTAPPPAGYYPPPAGYYPPPAMPLGSPATTIPGGVAPPADIRPSLGGIPPNSLPTTTLISVPPDASGSPTAPFSAKPTGASSFAGSDNFASEAPIRIVEAAPAAGSGSTLSSVVPFREPTPPTVVQANPAFRTAPAAIPAVPFNASGSAAEVSTLPRPGIHAPAIPAVPLDKTRGFMPTQPSGAGSFRTDSSVKPAGYVEAVPSAAAGQWRAR